MNEVVREWVEKAEGDFRTARREMAAKVKPNYDAVCFHAQQCVEKLMKTLLISKGVTPPKTHDLVRLNELLRLLSRIGHAFSPTLSCWIEPPSNSAVQVSLPTPKRLRSR